MTEVSGVGANGKDFLVNQSNKLNEAGTNDNEPSIFYSKYEKGEPDGKVDVNEQRSAVVNEIISRLKIMSPNTPLIATIIGLVNKYVNITDDIITDGTEASANKANEQVEQIINENVDNLISKYGWMMTNNQQSVSIFNEQLDNNIGGFGFGLFSN